MNSLRNERGIALVTSLLLTLITLAMIMALLYVVTLQTQLSAAHKRYKTALEAAQGGGIDIYAKQIIPKVFANITGQTLHGQFPEDNNLVSASGACLQAKLNSKSTPTGSGDYPLGWGAYCGSDNSPSNPTNLFDPSKAADIKLTLQGANANSNFNVYAKIVDTVPGNSDQSGYADLLESGAGVVGSVSGQDNVPPKHMPAMYRIEVQGQKEINPEEKARLSVLYAY